MASRLKRLFFGKTSSTSSNPNLKGKCYDSAIALDPPVKGSYPVAGNGPNVLAELQRSRSKREARRQSLASTKAAPPTIPRFPDDIIERPRTAPHNGRPGGGYNGGGRNDTHGRTRSGFSMKSPPNFFNPSRRSSIHSAVEPPPPPVPTPISKPSTPKPREIKTYQPRKVAEPPDTDVSSIFTPPYVQHQRNASQMSHRSYVDLLDAHSSIRPSRDVSRDRAKASGMRNYGEDVADRNIAAFDLNSPEFSYLKSVYVPQKSGAALPKEGAASSRASSAAGHGLAQEKIVSDDIQLPQHQTKANSTRSTNSPQSRPVVAYPPRIDSTSAVTYASNRRQHDDWLPPSVGLNDHRVRTLSPFSTSASIDEEPEDAGLHPGVPTASTPPIPARGRARTLTKDNHKPPPVSFSRGAVPVLSQQKPTGSAPSLKDRRRTMSEASQSSAKSGGTHSRSGSATYSAFPSPSRQDFSGGSQSAARGQSHGNPYKRTGMIVEGATEPPSLEGLVDLSNTVDTDVTTKTLPAVTHEKVLPTRHEIREERITREIHTHDVFHRILPVIETEILPPKHYVPSPDGKGLIEIPEHMVPGRTANGSPNRNWEIVQTAMGQGDHGSILHRKTASQQSRMRSKSLTSNNYQYTHPSIDEDESADGPVISYTRSELSNHSRVNSRTSTHTSKSSISKNILEPILSGKKEHITKESYPKTEYVWRHPPVFETATGQTQPIYLGAGVGNLSSIRPKTAPGKSHYEEEDDDDTAGANFGAIRGPLGEEEEFLFRDSGYGSGGMLPGLMEKTPLAGMSGEPRFIPEDFEVIQLGRVVGDDSGEKGKERDNSEGEATRALRRLREKRRSSGATSVASTVKAHDRGGSVEEMERGWSGLNVRG